MIKVALKPIKALVYARSATGDLQAIEEQLRLCREYAEKHNWLVEDEYTDCGSGATLQRPGLQALLCDAGRTKPCVVLAQDLARLSRNPADTAGLLKRLSGLDVRVVTVCEGTAGPTSLVSSVALYCRYSRYSSEEPEALKHSRQATIVRRIFRDYLDGISPTEITTGLKEKKN